MKNNKAASMKEKGGGYGRSSVERRREDKRTAFKEAVENGKLKRFWVDPEKLNARDGDFSSCRRYKEPVKKKAKAKAKAGGAKQPAKKRS